jgi:hypothetical protein
MKKTLMALTLFATLSQGVMAMDPAGSKNRSSALVRKNKPVRNSNLEKFTRLQNIAKKSPLRLKKEFYKKFITYLKNNKDEDLDGFLSSEYKGHERAAMEILMTATLSKIKKNDTVQSMEESLKNNKGKLEFEIDSFLSKNIIAVMTGENHRIEGSDDYDKKLGKIVGMASAFRNIDTAYMRNRSNWKNFLTLEECSAIDREQARVQSIMQYDEGRNNIHYGEDLQINNLVQDAYNKKQEDDLSHILLGARKKRNIVKKNAVKKITDNQKIIDQKMAENEPKAGDAAEEKYQRDLIKATENSKVSALEDGIYAADTQRAILESIKSNEKHSEENIIRARNNLLNNGLVNDKEAFEIAIERSKNDGQQKVNSGSSAFKQGDDPALAAALLESVKDNNARMKSDREFDEDTEIAIKNSLI